MRNLSSAISKNIIPILLLSLIACGGGGSSGDTDNSNGNGNSGEGTVSLDTDGDGLTDEEEATYGTHPNVTDTDGDGFLDKEEVDNWDRFSGTHLRFNPLVADVPRIRIEPLGAPVIQLYATYNETESIYKGMTNASLDEVTVTNNRGRINTNVIEEQHAVNVNPKVEQIGPVTSGSIAVSYDYQHSDTTTNTNYWNEQTVETNRRSSSDFYEILRSESIDTKGGEIKILMGILNDGDVSYTLNNMDLTAYMENPKRPGDLISVGTLVYKGDMTFTPSPLGTGVEPTSGDYTLFNFVYTAVGNPEEISRILENSNQLVLKPTNLSLTGQRSDVDLGQAVQNTRARTAEVIIDFGDSQLIKTERYRVAVDNGNGENISFEELMNDRLNFDYVFSSESFPGSNQSHTGLSSVRSLAMNTETKSYWLVAHTFTPVGSPQGTTTTRLYNILKNDYAAGDILLRKGDVLHLVYITDTDLDGLSDRLEVLKGTNINLNDSDDDGLDDAMEVYGWYTNLAQQPCDQGDDLALVFSNPLKWDSDGDGIKDGLEFENCSNPQGELVVEIGDMQLTDISSTVTLQAQASNFQNSSSLRYFWKQTAGTLVGQLANNASISFNAPAEVDKLEFQVTVTDMDKMDVSATDTVSVFVLRDKTNAVFIDPDTGHDFDNSGRTPDSSLKTIPRALESSFSGSDIYLNTPDNGTFELSETIVLPASANLYGGFDVDWNYSPATEPTPIIVNQAVALSTNDFSDKIISGISIEASAPEDGQENSWAIAAASGNNLTLKHVIAQGSDLTTVQPQIDDIKDFITGSSYGVYALDLERLDVIDSTIKAGRGANGVRGRKGNNGAPGDTGSNGSGRSGGAGGSGHNGGNGGRGGAAAKAALCADGSAGNKGANSTSNSGSITGGGGGGGGDVKFLLICILEGYAGKGGSPTTRAETRAQGIGAENSESFSDGLVIPANGKTVGQQGRGGAGGGGGGGGPGADFNDGGGGGGGGEGGEGGYGGNVGRGGGGSFALSLSSVNFVSITNSEIVSSDGGTGGAGGLGGTGGYGGLGGTGADSRSRKGGTGGTGSPGGHGAGGGGGAGGSVAAILLLNGSELEITDSQITTRLSGNGSNSNRGQGGWNYGIFVESSIIAKETGNTFDIGSEGNDAAPAAATNL